MAISWGPWEYGSSSAGFRVGHDIDRTDVTHTSTSVTWTIKVYVEAMYNVDDDMTVTWSDSLSGSSTQNLTTGTSGGTKLWATKTYTYTYGSSSYGASPGTRDFTSSLSGVYNGATPSKTSTVTIPTRPYGTPDPVSNVSEVRNSDTQATVSWTRNATTGEPYDSIEVRMKEWTGSVWTSYAVVANLSGSATSYVKTGLQANRVYQFAVRPSNNAGTAAFAYDATPYVRMTPGAPTNVASTLASTGSSITTTWTENAYTDPGNTANITYTVERSVAGGAWGVAVSGLSYTTTSWTDASPGAGTNVYRVKAVQSVGSLSSAYGTGNVLSTQVAPLAPTLLAPNGAIRDFARSQIFTWQHNHGGDASVQSHFRIRYSSNGGSTWTTLANDVASTVSSYTVPANTFANGTPYIWQVQTEGVVAAGYGPWSASATFTGSSTPVVTILTPSTSVTDLPLIVSWDYTQAQGSGQQEWEVSLYDSTGTVLLEQVTGATTDQSAPLTYPLVNGSSYQVQVRARSGTGIWSATVQRTFTFTLLPPAQGFADVDYFPESGTVVLHLTADPANPGTTVAADTIIVARRVDGGGWATLATDLPIPSDFVDLLPSTNGLNEYRITTVSTSPSYNVGLPILFRPPNPLAPEAGPELQWVFLNYGDDFSTILRFRSAPEITETSEREKALHDFLGRERPYAVFGDNATREVAVSGSLVFNPDAGELDVDDRSDSTPKEWTLAARVAKDVCYRDFTGRRIFGTLSAVSAADVRPGLGTVGFTVTESDYAQVLGWVDREIVPSVTDLLDGGDADSGSVATLDGGPAPQQSEAVLTGGSA